MIKEEDKKRILDLIIKRVERLECPICHKDHFSFVDGYSFDALADDYHSVQQEGRILPYVMLVCDNCGFISQHALGTFDLITRQERGE